MAGDVPGAVLFACSLNAIRSPMAAAGLRVHLANGLYLNALLDRLTGGFRIAKSF